MSSISSNSPTATPEQRLSQLTAWLATLGLVQVGSRRPASADASFRRYFRLDVVPELRATLGATLIAMDAPPEREDSRAFVHVANLLRAAGLNAPQVVASDLAKGFLDEWYDVVALDYHALHRGKARASQSQRVERCTSICPKSVSARTFSLKGAES